MALFHLSVTQTKRSAGQSAIASAAYRAGERLYSEYYGEYSDYTRKGGVICSDILLPSASCSIARPYPNSQLTTDIPSKISTCAGSPRAYKIKLNANSTNIRNRFGTA